MAWDESSEVSRVERSLAAYLRTAPDAADTLVGILRWWLPREHQTASLEVVAAALVALERAGRVVPRQLPDGRLLFEAVPPPRDGRGDVD